MASFVSHYFLAKEIQDKFSPRLKALVAGQEDLYLLGNQGPDLFFFQISKQVKKEKNLGTLLHDRPFRSLLEDLKKIQPHLAQKPGALAYFLGLCNHFFVDASIHPTVNALAQPDFDHISIEGELDRYFIEKNGRDLNGFRQSKLFAPSYDLRAIWTIYQGFGATLSDIQKSLRDLKLVKKIFQPRGPWQEKILLGLLRLVKMDKAFGNQLVPQVPNPKAEKTNQALMAILDSCPQEAAKFTESIYLWLTEDSPLPDLVDLDFNGRKQ